MRDGTPQYIGPERQLPEASETEPRVLVDWVEATSKAAKTYTGTNQEEYEVVFKLLHSYEQYLQKHFAERMAKKTFKNGSEADEYLKYLIDEELAAYPKFSSQTQNLPKVGQEMLDAMIRGLRENPRKGIIFIQAPEVLVPTFGGRRSEPGAGPFELGEYINKLDELLVYLKEEKLFGEHILVTEGNIKGAQMRQYPYMLIEIPELQKQILICNQLGEAIFVSQKWMGHEIFEEADKEELKQEHGLERVVYDRGGKWLERVKGLLLSTPDGQKKHEDFSEIFSERPKFDIKTFAVSRAEVLSKFPTDMDFVSRFLSSGYERRLLDPELKQEFGLTAFQFERRFTLEPKKLAEAEAASNVSYKGFLIACLSLYPDSKQLKYMLDLHDPVQAKKMLKGGYKLDGVKGIKISKRTDRHALGLFDLEPQTFPTFEDFWEKVMVANRNSNAQISIKLIEMYGFGLTRLATLFGPSRPNKSIPSIPELCQALVYVYPESEQLKYLAERNTKEGMIKIIIGEHDLSGIRDYDARKGIRFLKPVPCPKFKDFCKNFPISSIIDDQGKTLNESFGFASRAFVARMGVKVGSNVHKKDILEALQQVYPDPESAVEIQALIGQIRGGYKG